MVIWSEGYFLVHALLGASFSLSSQIFIFYSFFRGLEPQPCILNCCDLLLNVFDRFFVQEHVASLRCCAPTVRSIRLRLIKIPLCVYRTQFASLLRVIEFRGGEPLSITKRRFPLRKLILPLFELNMRFIYYVVECFIRN